jgi:hypothetical protein
MLEYSEMPPVSSLYHECFLISAEADHRIGENSRSTEGKLPVQPVDEKELQKSRTRDGENINPDREEVPPGRERPKRGPVRFNNPDPILPGLQIKLSQDFQATVIIHGKRKDQWIGPTV